MSKETVNEDLKKQINRIKIGTAVKKGVISAAITTSEILNVGAFNDYIFKEADIQLEKYKLEVETIVRDKKLSEEEKQKRIDNITKKCKNVKLKYNVIGMVYSLTTGITSGVINAYAYNRLDEMANNSIAAINGGNNVVVPTVKVETPKKTSPVKPSVKVSTKPAESKKEKK